jgi:hypothetical protein
MIGENTARLTLKYFVQSMNEPADEIDWLDLQFVTPTSGSITGQMQTRESDGLKLYPITGSFSRFVRPP